MNLNFRKKNNNNCEKSELCERFSNNAASYVSYVHSVVFNREIKNDAEFKEQETNSYFNAVNYMINFMRENFSDADLDGSQALSIDLSKIDFLSNSVLYLLNTPAYSSLIYVLDDSHSPHIHLVCDTIEQAENLELLPDLNDRLRKKWINKIFEGLNVVDAKCLLNQMGLLPEDCELNREINRFNETVKQHNNFLESVICMLLNSKNRYDVIRARLLADSFSFKFDFSPYDSENVAIKKKYQKPDC